MSMVLKSYATRSGAYRSDKPDAELRQVGVSLTAPTGGTANEGLKVVVL